MQQEETKKVKRIQQISVTNLFGIFNHTIPLNLDERITIIHGPNGFGKTMMLKLLYALFSQNDHLLQTIPFDEFRVTFEDTNSFWISKTIRPEEGHFDEKEIVFHATGKQPYLLRSNPLNKANTFFQLKFEDGLQEDSLQLTRAKAEAWQAWLHMRSENAIVDFGEPLSIELTEERAKIPAWLGEVRKAVPMRFIETQRLLRSTKPARRIDREKLLPEYVVTEDSKHLVEMIRRKLAESASLSQSLDRTFPARLISPTTQQLQVKEEELLKKLDLLDKKRERLMVTGLLNQETEAVFPVNTDEEKEINSNTKAVLAVYAEDTERKLSIFDELARKIDLLTTIINSRFLYKKMTIDKERGLVFTSENGTVLPLEDLSSGEQHELVLFYELLFKITPGSLVLIDEPELSLHVVWQEQFLNDVQQVTQLANIDIVLATHSPDIIRDRRDLVVELEAPAHGRVRGVSSEK